MSTETSEWLRPSMLPKLAQCSHYRPEAVAGPAAGRGTMIDAASRDLIAGKPIETGAYLAEDLAAIYWNRDTAIALAGGAEIITDEDALRVQGLTPTGGTADAAIEANASSIDFKSGQKRNYREQQAEYALGFMDRCFVDEWTVYLLYCDEQEVETLRFTREEAEQIVRGVLAKVRDPNNAPTPNEYCGWCAQRWTCPARREAIGIRPLDGPGAVTLEDLSSPDLRDFCLRAKVVEDYAEKGREILKERMIGGEKVPGCSIVSKRGSRKVLWRWVEKVWKQIGTAAIGEAIGGAISESKLLPLVATKMPGMTIPGDDIQEMPGSTYVRVGKPKGGA